MPEKSPSPVRRYKRVLLAKGIHVAWQEASRKEVSRIKTLGIGGPFIEAPLVRKIGPIPVRSLAPDIR
jgi:hypothetical protein